MNRVAVVRASPVTDGAAPSDADAGLRLLGRVGIAARGVIYGLLAYLAFDIAASGSSPAQTSGSGALQEVANQPGAPFLLGILAFGTAAYAILRMVQAFTGKPGPAGRPSAFKRVGWFVIAAIYIGLCVRAVELIVGSGTSQSRSTNPQPWAAQVLRWPGGPEILGAVSVGVIAGGVSLAIWGFAHDYDKDLALERMSQSWRRVVKPLGPLGDLARGFLVALVGIYLMNAATVGDPAKAKSVDSALKSLAHSWYGPVLIGFVAVGLLLFSLYSFFDAKLRRF